MSGSSEGGAEKFFERFSISLNKEKEISQQIIIKRNNKRFLFFKKNRINVIQLNFLNNYDFFTKRNLNTIINNFRPNIVLTWMNRASNMLPSNRDFPFITVGRLGGYYQVKNYINCDYLIANTRDIRSYLIKEGWEPEKTFYFPNFVKKNNLNKLSENYALESSSRKILLCLGRFHFNKGFDLIINSLKFLPGHHLWLLRSGKLKENYAKLAKKIGVLDRITFFNWTDDTSKFYNSADILVCPSRIEPLGNIIIEAWAHKIPVIASDIMGPKVLIKHNINGLKFESENIEQLTKCINYLSSKKYLHKKLVKNGYNEYFKNYTEQTVMKKFRSFFKKVNN